MEQLVSSQGNAVILSEEVYSHWRRAGAVEGLTTDVHIAAFLLSLFEDWRSKLGPVETSKQCASCSMPLTLLCLSCHCVHVKSDTALTSKSDTALTTKSDTALTTKSGSRGIITDDPQTVCWEDFIVKDEGSDDQNGCDSNDVCWEDVKNENRDDQNGCDSNDDYSDDNFIVDASTNRVLSAEIWPEANQSSKENYVSVNDSFIDGSSQIDSQIVKNSTKLKLAKTFSLGNCFVNKSIQKADGSSSKDESLTTVNAKKCEVLEGEKRERLTVTIRRDKKKNSKQKRCSILDRETVQHEQEECRSVRRKVEREEKGAVITVPTVRQKRKRPEEKFQEMSEKFEVEERSFECSVCPEDFKDQSSCGTYELNLTGEEKRHKCDHCPAAFRSIGNLKAHRRKHTGERPFSCETCGKAFARSSTLEQHKRVHTNDRPYKCEECGDAFKQRGMLTIHRRKAHTFERPFECNVCGTCFVVKGHLQVHMQCHTGLRPFLCEVCGASFKQKGILKTHKMIHKGIRPFSCDDCGKAFYRQVDVRAHKKTHLNIRNIICSECGAAFGYNSALKRHMQKHTGFRPFKCSECEKKFASNSELKVHLRIHTGNKPYICDVCDRGFQTMGNMKKHRNNRHKQAPPYVSSNPKAANRIEMSQKMEIPTSNADTSFLTSENENVKLLSDDQHAELDLIVSSGHMKSSD